MSKAQQNFPNPFNFRCELSLSGPCGLHSGGERQGGKETFTVRMVHQWSRTEARLVGVFGLRLLNTLPA